MKKFDVLERFIKTPGPTGMESNIVKVYCGAMQALGCEVSSDRLGTGYAFFKGKNSQPQGASRPVVMLAAHADSLAFLVKYIDECGFVFSEDASDSLMADPRTLPGTRCQVLCRKSKTSIYGHFIPPVPLHMLTDEELDTGVNRSELNHRYDVAIDIGSKTEAETRKNVSIGDYIILASEVLRTGKRVIAPNLDNRAGLYCLYRLGCILQREPVKSDVWLVATTGEESGSGSADVAANRVRPDAAIVVDSSGATDQLRYDADFAIAKRYATISLGEGPVIARGPGVDARLADVLENIGVRGVSVIPKQIELGTWGTDAELIRSAGRGTPTALVSIPARNLHTGIETMEFVDIENTIRLCARFLRHFKG